MVTERRAQRSTKNPRRTLAAAKLTSKGQIKLPKAIREHFGLEAGDEIVFVQDATGTHLERRFKEDPLAKWVGYAKDLKGADVDRIIDEMRGR